MILGILVTYNPNISELSRNIKSIYIQVDKLIIFDNSSKNLDEIRSICSELNILLIESRINIGLASAYNFVLKNHLNGFDFYITFDQDTFICDNLIRSMLSFFELDKSIRIIAPSFEIKKNNLKKPYIFKDAVIQSATIFKSSLITEVGYFDDGFFIDSVDFEYCLKVRSRNFKIIQLNNFFIDHQLGESKSFLNIRFNSHNKIRNYYIARNHIILSKRYFLKFPLFIVKKNIFFTIHFLKLLFLDRDWTKINYFIRGLFHYKIN